MMQCPKHSLQHCPMGPFGWTKPVSGEANLRLKKYTLVNRSLHLCMANFSNPEKVEMYGRNIYDGKLFLWLDEFLCYKK